MTREVPLTQGKVALVDDADYDMVTAVGKWYAKHEGNTFYAGRMSPRQDGKQRTVKMHTLITGWGFVDHVNGDGLDNRRANLRAADYSKNSMNHAVRSDSTSGFKGVFPYRGIKWRAQIGLDGSKISLGIFDAPQEAALAYDAAAIELFGAFARLNFPQGVNA